jgi:ApaG protein
MSSETTPNEQQLDDIDVRVETTYLPAESVPERSRYVFAYTVTIRNIGKRPARLMTRHWIITDTNGKVEEVEGDGVVGEQPYLKPGEGFQYTSGTMLETPAGIMEGKYHMVTDNGDRFAAEIKPFTLVTPQMLH